MIPLDLPLAGEVLLVTDEVSSPADFVLHRNLTAWLKNSKDSSAIILSVSENLAKWKAIAGKSNILLSQHITSGTFMFVEVLSQMQPPTPGVPLDGAILGPLYTRVRGILADLRGHSPLVVLDDVSALEWMGFPTQDISRFVRALCALCQKVDAALIIRHHVVTPGDPDELLRLLLQISTYHMEVLPLSSGRSGTVSGQVALHPGPWLTNPKHRRIARNAAIQYRLTDTGCISFDRGTGGGVL